ncbi:hypothetical protein BJY52DRAFT_1193668 [Lactarius psammicola]|nr:hypothetical protein BJY52DRAFT_1193668 [Lactarius psammicola]
MDNQCPIPHADPQCHHVVQAYAHRFSKGSFQCLILQVPPLAERPDLNFQQNTPTPTQDTNATIPNCSCQRCSDAQRGQPTWYLNEQQDPQYFGNPVASYVNQGVDNRVETALTAPTRLWAQFVPPQTAVIQDNVGYAPVPERASTPNVGLLWAPISNPSITEGRRRLAGRYLNDPGAYVRTIRLEPGPSGQFQVIIVLEMANVL